MSGPSSPPRLGMRLIEWLAVDHDSAELLGDLHEAYQDRIQRSGDRRARLWYWRQVVILGWGLGRRRVRPAFSLEGIWRDVRLSLRAFRRAPGLVAAGVLTLGIGIGGPTTMFGILDALYTTLPVDRPEQIVSVTQLDPVEGRQLGVVADAYAEWSRAATTISAIGAYRSDNVAVSGSDFAPDRTEAAEVTPEVLSLLGVAPVVGRLLTAEDQAAGAPRTALIREDVWEAWLARSTRAIGTEIRVDGQLHTIVGVLPNDFGFPMAHTVWTNFRPALDSDAPFRAVARMQEDVSIEAVRAELDAMLAAVGPRLPQGWEDSRAWVEDYVLAMNGAETRSALRYLTLVVSFLIVIAAANVAALLLARGVSRSTEIAVRMSIGAARLQVARQLMIEALLLATGGALVGLGLTQFVTAWFAATLEARGVMPYWAVWGVTPSVFLFASLGVGTAALVAGLLPALRTTRLDLAEVMKAGSKATGSGEVRVLPALVGAEVTLSCTLLILCALVVKGALSTVQMVGAFPADNVLTGRLVLESYDYPDARDRDVFYQELSRTLEADPSVESFTLASAMPGDGTGRQPVRVEGVTYEREEDVPSVQRRLVGPAFFEMFGMSVLAGRLFASADRFGGPPVAVVNEAYARRHEADGPIVGRRLVIGAGSEAASHEVVGVVADPGVSVDDGQRVEAVFTPLGQAAPESSLIAVRAHGGYESALQAMTAGVRSLNAALPLSPIMTLEAIVRRENDGGRLFGSLFGGIGLAALILAIVGLQGVVAFTTQRRTRDIGICRALGAADRQVLRSTLVSGLRPVAVGVVLGTGLAAVLGPRIGEGLFGSSPHDPVVLGLVPLTLLVAATAAAYRPARRAVRIDPVTALRAE